IPPPPPTTSPLLPYTTLFRSLVSVGEDELESRPLRLIGTSLYLDRYWREERQVAADLRAFGGADAVDESALADGLARLFARPGGDRKSTRLNSSHEWISYAVF